MMLGQGFVRQGPRRGIALALLLTAVMALGAWATASAQGSTQYNYCAHQNAVFKRPRPFLGITDVAVEVNNGTAYSTLRECSLGQMAAAGVGYFREFIDWKWIEIQPNVYNFATLDGFAAAAAKHHMTVLAMVFNAPAWRSTAPAAGAQPGFYPPSSAQDYAYFVSLLVKRYGPHGTFWQQNPQVPYDPIRAWQIWNESDLAQSWEPQPDLAAYVRLLQAASVAIKRIDPHAKVVTAGMPFYTPQQEASVLSSLYRFGGRSYFDVLAIHEYAYNVGQAEQWLWGARQVMNRFGDRKKPLWVTEAGWSGGNPDLFITNFRKQRRSESQFFRFLARARGRLGLREFFWYMWQDRIWEAGPTNWWGFHEGFYTTSLYPKPSLTALRNAARRLDR
jgi:hypothetical protein